MVQVLEMAAALAVSYLITIFLWSLFFRPKGPRKPPGEHHEQRGDAACPTDKSGSKAE